MQGAALFAVLAPRARRAQTVRALVAFQAAYNYLDTLAEQSSADPVENARRLHRALPAALDPSAKHEDYYAYHPQREDGGYLLAMVEACRASVGALPSFPLVARSTQAAAARIVEFQSLSSGAPQGGHDGLERWAREQTPRESGLRWWESAAAGGSSLGVHALIGASAQPTLDSREVAAIDDTYFPWIGALHSLLDSVIDVAEDERDGQHNLLSHYASPADAAARLSFLAGRARSAARTLARSRRHEAIFIAMVCHYLSVPAASTQGTRAVTSGVTDAAGALVKPTLALFRAWRLASRLTRAGG